MLKKLLYTVSLFSFLNLHSEASFARYADIFYCPEASQLFRGEDGIIRGITTGDVAMAMETEIEEFVPGTSKNFLKKKPRFLAATAQNLGGYLNVDCWYIDNKQNISVLSNPKAFSEQYGDCSPEDFHLEDRKSASHSPMTCEYNIDRDQEESKGAGIEEALMADIEAILAAAGGIPPHHPSIPS